MPVFSSDAFIPANTVMQCIFPWQNDLWIGTNKGLFRYNVRTEISRAYYYNERDPFSLSQSYVTDINLTPDGVLVVGTLKGLNLYNAVRRQFYPHPSIGEQADGASGLNCNFINCPACPMKICFG